jgi:hypothetical protein
MDDDFDFNFDDILDGGGEPKSPTYRATIRNGRLTVTGWAPWLARGGPLGSLLRARERADVAIADLTIHGEDDEELSVRFHAAGRMREEAERVLLEWASRVGYRRVWLPDRMIEIEPAPEQIGTASVRCPTCRAQWADSGPDFWLSVREQGAFPSWCPLCGCELPQWTVSTDRRGATPGRCARPTRWRASDSRDRTRHEKA